MSDPITLTAEECREIFDLIDQLSGCNASYVFGDDDDEIGTLDRAAGKIYLAAGEDIPEWVRKALEEAP